MPLHDHFRPPMSEDVTAGSLHTQWAGEITRRLNSRWLRDPFRARPHHHSGSDLEIDIAAQEHRLAPAVSVGGGTATLTATCAQPAVQLTGPAVNPEVVEVRIFEGPGSWYLVGAIEIISPSNKKSPEERDAFIGKCASYLRSGASVAMIDIVTDRHAQMHDALLDLLRITGGRLPAGAHLCASAYRPVQRGGRDELDAWFSPCRVGEELPTMPLRLTGDLFVPVEFELTYLEALRSLRVGGDGE